MLPKALQEKWNSGIAISAAALVLSAVFASVGGVKAQEEQRDQEEPEATATPYAQLQYSTLSASGNTLNLTMVPVVQSNGVTVYKNLTIPLKVAETIKGTTYTETVTAGAVTETTFPLTYVANFKAGPYTGPGGGKAQEITLVGPGVVVNGATEWSLSTTAGATGCTYPATATFYAGPLTSNPFYSRLKKAGITSTAYSYGLIGNGSNCFPGDAWYGGSIVGLAQTGNSLTIVSFTHAGTDDQSTPADEISYMYQ
jgi:hypothetical protein